MKREEYRNGYHRQVSPGSDSDDYVQQPRQQQQQQQQERHQSNTKPTARQSRRPTQQYTSSRYERYEYDPPTLQDREVKGRGNLVRFYKDEDSLHRGVTVSINAKQFKTIGSLCEFLNKKIDCKMGVRHIFNPKTRKEVKDITELERDNNVCIVSSFPRYKKDAIMYNMLLDGGSPTKSLRSSRDQGRNGYHQERLQSDSSNRTPNSTAGKQVTFEIISNTCRYSKEKMILNPQTAQPFEKILEDMGTMVQLRYPPATGIFSARKPYQQIFSFSQLNKEVKLSDSFYVCGKELYPEELQVTNGTDDSPSEPEPEPVKKTRKAPPTKVAPSKQRNEVGQQSQKDNAMKRQNGRIGKDPTPRKPPSKIPRQEDDQQEHKKGNKTSRYEESNGHVRGPRHEEESRRKPPKSFRHGEDQQQKRPPPQTSRYEEEEPVISNRNSRYEEDVHENTVRNSRYDDEDDAFIKTTGDPNGDQVEEDDEEEDEDDGEMSPLPVTSRTRKQERMESPEY